ncbi:MAG: four helix bundle protein [Saprospiraceae bacterium]|nr:four helix bundle protein [Saprospiraceae bacterium]
MEYTYSFEKLDIWKISIELSMRIYKSTTNFPREEKFGIVSQLRRAVTSISANIAEGSCRFGEKDKARFFQIAYGSAIEVLNFLIISEKLNYINNEEVSSYRLTINELTNKINSYNNKIAK